MIPRHTSPFFLALPAIMAVFSAGCTSTGADYPSLAIRDAERISAEVPAPTLPEAAEPIPASILAEVKAALAKAERAHANFTARTPAVRNTIEAARGSAVGSDRWAGAQVALSELDSLRASTAIALGELDLLYAARAVELERRDAIAEVRDDLTTILARQDAVLASLKPILSQ